MISDMGIAQRKGHVVARNLHFYDTEKWYDL